MGHAYAWPAMELKYMHWIFKKNEIYFRKLLLESTCWAPIRMRSWCYCLWH
jgi:hypothetical protein